MAQTIENSYTSTGNRYQISSWFPTAFYIAPDLTTNEENNFILEKIKQIEQSVPKGGDNWQCNMYNTCGTYNLITDENFKFLFERIDQHIFEYVKHMGSSHRYQCQEAWINVSYQNSFQEYHTHADRTISAVYYASIPENSGRIVFENPLEPDMLPIKNITNYNYWNNLVAHFTPEPGTLLIFRSYLRHMVELNNSSLPRITIAMNY